MAIPQAADITGPGLHSDLPASYAEPIIVATEFTAPSRGIYVGGDGDMTCKLVGSVTPVAFIAVKAGSILPLVCTEVTAATATNLVALY